MDENIEKMLSGLIKMNTISYTCYRCKKTWKSLKGSYPSVCKFCHSPVWDKPLKAKKTIFKFY